MINKLPFVILLFFITSPLLATIDTSVRGDFSAKSNYYLKDADEVFGTRARFKLQQETKFNTDFTLVNQLRFTYSSLYTDISNNTSNDPTNTREFYLGDNYLKYKSSSWILQTGYQDIGWGEAFGFNYADLVNPKDLRETFYTDYGDSKLPLFLMNFKYFFENGSMQLIYSPEPRFSRTLPLEVFTKDVFPQANIKSNIKKTPDFFKEHEFGGKLAKSFGGIDASLFYYSYLDRDASYSLRSASLTNIELDENHSKVKSTGISVASTLLDNFVFRTDVVYTQDKIINSVQGLNLLSTSTDVTNVVLSFDTPTFNDFSGVFVVANSRLSKDIPKAFREKNQTYSIAKIGYNLGQEKSIDLSYTHEWNHKGHALQSLFLWPVGPTTEIRVGAESYWGDKSSQLSKIRNVSNIFLGIKNYFQL